MQPINSEVQKQAWEKLNANFSTWWPLLGCISVKRLESGQERSLEFELTRGTFDVPLGMVVSQANFKRKVFEQIGFPIPNCTSSSWDEFCGLLYLAADEVRKVDDDWEEAVDLITGFLSTRTSEAIPEDAEQEKGLLGQVKAGTLRAYKNSGNQWVFKLSDLMDYGHRHGSPIKRPEMTKALLRLGFERAHFRDTRVWLSPEGWGSSVTDA